MILNKTLKYLALSLLIVKTINQSINYPYDNQVSWDSTCTLTQYNQQSPINIVTTSTDYSQRMSLQMINIGYSSVLTPNLQLIGSFAQLFAIDLNQQFRGYTATSIEFHQKSEHYVNGQQYSAEIQINFIETVRSQQYNRGAKMNQAVVSFLLSSDQTQALAINGVFQDFAMLQYLNPSKVGVKQSVNMFQAYSIDTTALINNNNIQVYVYNGSKKQQTTCSQVVTYYVYQQIFYISPATLATFQTYMANSAVASIYFAANGTNDRSIQPTSGRNVVLGKVIANLNQSIHIFINLFSVLIFISLTTLI